VKKTENIAIAEYIAEPMTIRTLNALNGPCREPQRGPDKHSCPPTFSRGSSGENFF